MKIKRVKIKTEKATFAAGCFWHVEEAFRTLEGVVETTVGYAGGKTKNPTYAQVCTDKTGHAEAVLVEFNPKIISFKQLLEIFWNCHDPTQLNKQGPDVGTQYRSVIFYRTQQQKKLAIASKKALEKSGRFKRQIVTKIVSASTFYKAEEYHQKYLVKRGLSSCPV